MILDTIREKKLETLEDDIQDIVPRTHGKIATAIKQHSDLYVIGEIKKASPSKGIIVEDFDVDRFARDYENAGIDALSVLSERHFFLGDTSYITRAKQHFTGPVLRKDFLLDIREVIQSKQYQADLILLIVAILSDEQLKVFYQCARALELECIVEVHNEQELQRALRMRPEIIGINNRDLNTFEVSLQTTQTLASMIPKDIAIIAESGIFTHQDMCYMKECGVDGVLIGESFMRADNIHQHLQVLQYGKD